MGQVSAADERRGNPVERCGFVSSPLYLTNPSSATTRQVQEGSQSQMILLGKGSPPCHHAMRNMYPILRPDKCLARPHLDTRFIRSTGQNIRHKSETFLPATAISAERVRSQLDGPWVAVLVMGRQIAYVLRRGAGRQAIIRPTTGFCSRDRCLSLSLLLLSSPHSSSSMPLFHAGACPLPARPDSGPPKR